MTQLVCFRALLHCRTGVLAGLTHGLRQVCTRDQGVEAMGEADALIKHERNACRRGQVERPLVDRLIAKKEQLQTDIARQERTEGGTYAELQVRGVLDRCRVLNVCRVMHFSMLALMLT